MGLSKIRRFLYNLQRFLGTVQMVGDALSGRSRKAGMRAANKIIGRTLVSKMWRR